jgi:glutamate formiminotransferase/formiminotetrahydrofolate cyclodeaminase
MVPFKVMETAFSGFELIREMVEKGNPNSITDAGVGALALRSCIMGTFLNVKINAAGLQDKDFVKRIIVLFV